MNNPQIQYHVPVWMYSFGKNTRLDLRGVDVLHLFFFQGAVCEGVP